MYLEISLKIAKIINVLPAPIKFNILKKHNANIKFEIQFAHVAIHNPKSLPWSGNISAQRTHTTGPELNANVTMNKIIALTAITLVKIVPTPI